MDNLQEMLKTDPMARYVPNRSEIEKICDDYKIGELVYIDGELGGLFNVNLKITTTSGQYVLRVQLEQLNLHEPSLIKETEHLYQLVMEYWLPKEDALIKTIIHADWHPWNVLFDETTEIKHILDFDFLQKGERIHDIAYFLWAMREFDNNEELGRSFLYGYGELTTVEVEMLPVAIARASLFFLCTASFVSDPVHELKQQMKEQKPYIEWLLSKDGMLSIKNLSLLS